jgi:hypothetical protein
MDAFCAWREDHPKYDSDGRRYYDGHEEADLIGAFVADVFANAGTDFTDAKFKSLVDEYCSGLGKAILERREEIMGSRSGAVH